MTSLALEQILADLRPAAGRLAAERGRRHRARRIAAGAGGALGCAAALATAATQVFDAPDAVRRDFLAVDAGMPADLRLNPDVEHARRVALSDHAVVYFAPLRGGGYCAELVTGGHPRGAVCSTAEQTDRTPLGVTIPFTDPVRDDSPVTVSGHVAVDGATHVRFVYPDGASDLTEIAANGFYVFEVPAQHLAAVHRHGLMLNALNADGAPLADAVVPADAITPPPDAERHHDPIEVDTISDGRDFTLVLGVRGKVYENGATQLRLRYPDGSARTVRLGEDSRYSLAIPPEHQRDFARRAGTLEALDKNGRVVADRPVASVAYWHAR